MDSSNEEPTQKIKNASEIVQETPPKNNSAVCKKKCPMPTLTLIIALLALSLATYTYLLNYHLHHQLTEEKTHFSAQLKQQNQVQIDGLKKQTQYVQTQLDSLSKEVHTAMNQPVYQTQDWLLFKARYCLELAQINARWSYNQDATIALLEQADSLLTQFNTSETYTVRQAIAKDLTQIKATPSVDYVGLLSQLDAAQNTIHDLNIIVSVTHNESITENSTDKASSAWSTRLKDSINVLKKMVIIEHHDQTIQQPLSPILENLLKENLHLNLQEAQVAVLNHEPVVYQLVLKQAINMLKMNFNANKAHTTALMKTLNTLQHINVAPNRPEIGLALPLINELINRKNTLMHPSEKHGGTH